MKTTSLLLLILGLAGSVSAQGPLIPEPTAAAVSTPSFISDSLDLYIRRGMKDWQVPGLALVIVKDGKVVLAKGYGVKDIHTNEPVDENTLFMIASNTKLFTSTALAQLEADRKLSLEDKVTKYFPDFQLYELASTQLVSIKDLLCHRIGTKTFQGDFTFWNSELSREEIIHRIRLLKPSRPFRQDFGYCNSCVMTAGQVIPKVTGVEWDQYVEDSLLRPLQMRHTYTSLKEVPTGISLSQPYTTVFSGSLHVVPLDHWDNLGPAASLISNVSDLSHWLLCQLDSGRYEGNRVLPFSVLQRTRDINTMLTSRKSPSDPTHIMGYALGLEVMDYDGRQVYWHTGGAAGMVSIVSFVPEEKLGIAILTNNDNQDFFVTLRQQIMDAYLGMPYEDRSGHAFRLFNEGMLSSLKKIDGWKARVKGMAPPLPLEAWCGSYTHPLYGTLDIRQKGKGLTIKFNSHANLTATLDYMDNGEWLMSYDNIEYGIFAIRFRTEGSKVLSIETRQNDFVEYDPYTFTKE